MSPTALTPPCRGGFAPIKIQFFTGTLFNCGIELTAKSPKKAQRSQRWMLGLFLGGRASAHSAN